MAGLTGQLQLLNPLGYAGEATLPMFNAILRYRLGTAENRRSRHLARRAGALRRSWGLPRIAAELCSVSIDLGGPWSELGWRTGTGREALVHPYKCLGLVLGINDHFRVADKLASSICKVLLGPQGSIVKRLVTDAERLSSSCVTAS